MTDTNISTKTFDDIAAHGNRGHNVRLNNLITCADGTRISVVAGGGTYSSPQPDLCINVPGHPHKSFSLDGVPCDYPGPYTMVEVLTNDPELMRLGGAEPDDHRPVALPTEAVRQFIIDHGGEDPDSDRTEPGDDDLTDLRAMLLGFWA